MMAETQARLADILRKQGRTEEALKNYEEALENFRQDAGNNLRNLARIFNAEGEIVLDQPDPDYDRTMAYFTDTWSILNVYSGEQADRDEVARAMINLASIGYIKPVENPSQAEANLKDAEELFASARLISPNAQEMATNILQKRLENLGKEFARGSKNVDASASGYEQVLKLKEDKINAGDLTQVEIAEVIIHGLDEVYRAQGNYEKLIKLYHRALDIRSKEHDGVKSTDVYKTYNDLGELYLYLKDYKSAEESYQNALRVVQSVSEKNQSSVLVVNSLINLANVYSEQGTYAQAEPLYKQAMLNLENGKRKDTLEMADILERYAEVLQNTNRATQAVKLKEDAKAIRSRLMRAGS
jgi:tetratricopeptide (TPR) repeat protein